LGLAYFSKPVLIFILFFIVTRILHILAGTIFLVANTASLRVVVLLLLILLFGAYIGSLVDEMAHCRGSRRFQPEPLRWVLLQQARARLLDEQ
jgi:hypothetical protein